jgi:eukaryotic-like serine/threonine-protein kinase
MSLVGHQIGRYRILEELGQGGMSIVYKGLDTSLDRLVAVKVLHAHLAQKPESRLRLEREARAVARLSHPNILEVYDTSGAASGASPEMAYIVTEYIAGTTLRAFLETEKLYPPELAVMVMHELSGALAHAHQAGVLHRDLKPDNVMIRSDGVLKLTDFGIAKMIDRDERMTMTGALVGSPAYMAPEIIEGEEAGAAADVFSLGTMLYFMSTGQLPFRAANTTATLKKILHCDYADPRTIEPAVSDELAKVIETCLLRDPNLRYRDAAALQNALSTLLEAQHLENSGAEFTSFIASPAAYRLALTQRLVERLLQRVQQAREQNRVAKSLSLLNQVLALDPDNANAKQWLAKIATQPAPVIPRRVRPWAALSAAGLTLVASVGAWRLLKSGRQQTPVEAPIGVKPSILVADEISDASFDPPPEKPSLVPESPVLAGDTASVAVAETTNQVVPAPNKKRRSASGSQPAPLPSAASLVDVKVQIRPFGFVAVDDGPPSAEPLQLHHLRLAPGAHRLKVTCELCDDAGLERKITVAPDMETITLAAPLKKSLVSFSGFPGEASVRIGSESKTVAESNRSPFLVKSPPGGSLKMRHTVRYEVSLGAKTIDSGERDVTPGQPTVIQPRGTP